MFWICVRRRNDGRITIGSFSQAVSRLNHEILADDSDFRMLSTPDSLLQPPMDLIDNHSINSTDALVLHSALNTATTLRNVGDDLVLIASDKRLVRTASVEGLLTFNPEIDAQQTLTHLMAS